MGRWVIIAAMGLVLAGLLGLLVRWLWHQRGRQASAGRKVLVLSASVSCVLILGLLFGGLQFLWLERRNQAVTVEDLRILERADAFLKDESAWNRKDDRQCDDDKASGKWSLSCALDVACIEELGHYEHARAALQEVRFVVEEVTHGRQFEGRLMGFNNLPETRFEDIKRVLRIARERVQERLKVSERRRPTRS
jgi:hypothetical protein